jgi:hypothetical protein
MRGYERGGGHTFTLFCSVNLAFSVSNEDSIKFDIVFEQLTVCFTRFPLIDLGTFYGII